MTSFHAVREAPWWYWLGLIAAAFFGAFLQYLGTQYLMRENVRLIQQTVALNNELELTKKKNHDLSAALEETETRAKQLAASADRFSLEYSTIRTHTRLKKETTHLLTSKLKYLTLRAS